MVDREFTVADVEQLDGALEDGLQEIGQFEACREIRDRRAERLLLVGAPALGAEQPLPPDGDARLMRRRAQHFEVVRAERVVAIALDHQHADELLVHEQRDVHLRAFVARGEVARRGRDLGRVVQPAVQQRQLAEPLARRHAQPCGGFIGSAGRDDDAIPARAIHQEHGDEVEPQGRIMQAVHHRAADRLLGFRGRDPCREPE